MDNHSSQYWQEVKNSLNGPLGQWLLPYLKEKATDKLITSSRQVPREMIELVEREQTFGRVNELFELIDEIPNIVNENLRNALNKEI